jgi:hypothetical protein
VAHPETPGQPWLRAVAALLALAAGAVHLGQVGVHLAEGWPIAGFFVVVGTLQIGAAGLLLRQRPRAWVWFGIAGSAAVIGVWVVSRTAGLWFVEGGEPEPVGVADGLASLTEAWTIVVLGRYLAEATPRWRPATAGVATSIVLGLTALWWVAADGGTFNADPARLAADQPWLVDWLVGIGGIALAAGQLLALRGPSLESWQRGLRRGLIGALAMSAVALVWLTLPPTIGQNLDCRHAPLSTVLGGGHEEVEPIEVGADERIFVPAFELHACGDATVMLEHADAVTTHGHGATIVGLWLLPTGNSLPDEGAATLPSGAEPVPPGGEILPAQLRQLVVGLEATGDGDFTLASLRLGYRTTDAGAFTFATQIAICSGGCDDL